VFSPEYLKKRYLEGENPEGGGRDWRK